MTKRVALKTEPDPAPRSLYLPIEKIEPNPWNPRRFPRKPDEEDKSLTESIRQQGVLDNLIVRQVGERYQLLAGERRLRCAKAAGVLTVPCTVRDVDDHQARVVTITENLHRKQLHYLEEAQGVAGLVEEGWTLDMVAAELGRPMSWVARRKRLTTLSLKWQKLAADPESFASRWSAAHFEHIAVLEPAAQDELLELDPWALDHCDTAQQLAREIGSRTRALSSFPWKLSDALLDPKAGACDVCPKRSSQNPGLFDDQEIERKKGRGVAGSCDRCLDPTCAVRKLATFVDRKLTQLGSEHSRVVMLKDRDRDPNAPKGALNDWQVEKAKKGEEGALPAVVVNGSQAGTVRWVKPRTESPTPTRPIGNDGKPLKKSLDQRREQKLRQRMVHAIDILKPAIVAAPVPPLEVSLRLAIVFGTEQKNDGIGWVRDLALPDSALDPAAVLQHMLAGTHHRALMTNDEPADRSATAGVECDAKCGAQVESSRIAQGLTRCFACDLEDQEREIDEPETATPADHSRNMASPLWNLFTDLNADSPEQSAIYLWGRVLPVLLSRMTPGNSVPEMIPQHWSEAERIALLVGLDPKNFLDRATLDLPDPKSWAKEEAALETPLATANENKMRKARGRKTNTT